MRKICQPVCLVLSLFFLLVACGAQPPQSKLPNSEKSEVVIGFSALPMHFDPLQGFGTGGQIIFSTLVRVNAQMDVIGDLAKDYFASEDGLSWQFNLRDDVFFSNGQKLTAEDVVFSCLAIKNNATEVDLSMLKNCEALDEKTILFTLNRPNSVFSLTLAQVGIVPKALYNQNFGLAPVGSGPYKLVQWDVDQQLILEANELYYGKEPAIKRAVFLGMKDEDARFLAVQAGQLDIAITSAAIAAGAQATGMELVRIETLDNMGIALPMLPAEGMLTKDGYPIGNDVTSDIAIRKALVYGIDRAKICEDALSDYAKPAFTENDGMPWNNPESKIETDVAYAVACLEKAGWIGSGGDGIREKNGQRAEFPLLYFTGDSTRQAVAMAVAAQAKEKLGIEITVEGVGEADLLPRMFAEPMILAWGSSNPQTSYMLFHSSNAGNVDWYNPENYKNQVVDGYLDAALNAHSLEEAVPHWQKAQWDGTTGTSMRGDAPYLFLINKSHLYWARSGLDIGEQKIHAHGDDWPLVANLEEWKWKKSL